ncbi:hypothetical protein [Burkholderia paludis]|uniref:hypothetical protein n=1 Tax=Burkholderia paludis TaxID=1506587 RepID=UPI00126A02EA|nr:hypothetical protein [Burkholderia paludis]
MGLTAIEFEGRVLCPMPRGRAASSGGFAQSADRPFPHFPVVTQSWSVTAGARPDLSCPDPTVCATLRRRFRTRNRCDGNDIGRVSCRPVSRFVQSGAKVGQPAAAANDNEIE